MTHPHTPTDHQPTTGRRSALFALALAPLAAISAAISVGPDQTAAAFTDGDTKNSNTFATGTVAAPTNLTATRASGAINLAWTASPTSAVTGYRIERATSANGPWTTLATVTGRTTTTYSDTTAGSGQQYYRVAANVYSWTSPSISNSVAANRAPSQPTITRSPSGGSITPGTAVTITATSSDPDGDTLTYIWDNRPSQTYQYPLGRQVVTVKAVDPYGTESPQAATVFFMADSAHGGGMMLTSPESRIIEPGIPGGTITSYTFTVPSVNGHSGNDYAWVRGYRESTGQWEQVAYRDVSNGVYLSGSLTPGIYSQLMLFYYASHCMYNQSNITYSVEYAFS